MLKERVYAVEGMTCGHCSAAVERVVGALAGVREAHAELSTGRLIVHGEDIDDAHVATAVAEAGYEVKS